MIENIEKVQRQFIFLLLNNKDLIEKWLNSDLKIKHFNNKFHIILTTIIDTFNKDVLLTRKTFHSIVIKLRSAQDKLQQEIVFNECIISMADKNDFPLLLSQILDDYLLRISTQNIKKFTKNVNQKSINVAINELIDRMQELSFSSVADQKIIYDDFRSFSKERMEYVQGIRSGKIKEPPRILCDIKEIDETMYGGFDGGSLTVFCADTGEYKSWIMLNIALNIWNKGYNVLHVPIEMSYKRMYQRAWSRESHVPLEKILDPMKMSDKEEERLLETQKKWEKKENKFYILDFPNDTTVPSIEHQVHNYIDIFYPKVVIIDYLENIQPDKERREREDLEIRDMCIRLRSWGKEMNFAVITAAQLGKRALEHIRESLGGKKQIPIKSHHIRGAHTLPMYADNIYAQIVRPEQADLLDMYVVKVREGKNIFPNGTFKGTLEIIPEIGLIRSQEGYDMTQIATQDKVLNKIMDGEENNNSTIVFDGEEEEFTTFDDGFSFLD